MSTEECNIQLSVILPLHVTLLAGRFVPFSLPKSQQFCSCWTITFSIPLLQNRSAKRQTVRKRNAFNDWSWSNCSKVAIDKVSTILENISVILWRRNNCNVNNELKWRNHSQIRQDKQNDEDQCEEAFVLTDKGSYRFRRQRVAVRMNSLKYSHRQCNGKSVEMSNNKTTTKKN